GGDGGDVGRMRRCDKRGGGSDCGGRLLLPEGVEARGGGDRIDLGRIYLFIIWDSPEKFSGGGDMGDGSVERVVDEWQLVVLVLAVGRSKAGDDEGGMMMMMMMMEVGWRASVVVATVVASGGAWWNKLEK
ncbi:hypothetical protein Tco_1231258, partial [Tanacetum coccineum]